MFALRLCLCYARFMSLPCKPAFRVSTKRRPRRLEYKLMVELLKLQGKESCLLKYFCSTIKLTKLKRSSFSRNTRLKLQNKVFCSGHVLFFQFRFTLVLPQVFHLFFSSRHFDFPQIITSLALLVPFSLRVDQCDRYATIVYLV